MRPFNTPANCLHIALIVWDQRPCQMRGVAFFSCCDNTVLCTGTSQPMWKWFFFIPLSSTPLISHDLILYHIRYLWLWISMIILICIWTISCSSMNNHLRTPCCRDCLYNNNYSCDYLIVKKFKTGFLILTTELVHLCFHIKIVSTSFMVDMLVIHALLAQQ